MDDKLFDTEPLLPRRAPVSARTGRPLSKRTLAQREAERRRLGAMHAKHGHGPDGQTCRDCAFLVQREFARTYFKCQRYNVTSSEATDWRSGWPACGAFQRREGDRRHAR